MPTTTKPKGSQTLETLAKNVRTSLAASKKEFDDACKALVDYLLLDETKMIFQKTEFIDKFCRGTLYVLSQDADKAGKNFWSTLAKISAAYEIEA